MSLSKSKRFRILTRDRFRCRYCGRSAPSVVLHVDHIHPVSRGGKDDDANLVTACVDCNSSKSDKLLPVDVAAVSSPVEQTFPDLDRCSYCRGGQLYAALSEQPAQQRYVAFYECDRGHTWRTYWSNIYRRTRAELDAYFRRSPAKTAPIFPATNGAAPGQLDAF